MACHTQVQSLTCRPGRLKYLTGYNLFTKNHLSLISMRTTNYIGLVN